MSSLDEMLAPMSLHRDVAPGVHRLQDGPVNWYLVEADNGVLAVDAGLPSSWTSLRHALGAIGRPYADLRALVLTHAHFDHVGIRPPRPGRAGAAGLLRRQVTSRSPPTRGGASPSARGRSMSGGRPRRR